MGRWFEKSWEKSRRNRAKINRIVGWFRGWFVIGQGVFSGRRELEDEADRCAKRGRDEAVQAERPVKMILRQRTD